MYRKVHVEIDLDVIGRNVANITRVHNDFEYYIGVVKGNAYGHGFGVVPTLLASGVNYLAVSSLDEAFSVRRFAQDTPILIMEPVSLDQLSICDDQCFTVTISNYEYFKSVMDLRFSNLKLHIKLDTGLNRLGVDSRERFEEMYHGLVKKDGVLVEGIFTHLATTGVLDDLYDKQIAEFLELTAGIDLSAVPIVHVDRSATLETKPKLPFVNGVRMGALMFGINHIFRPYGGLKGKLRQIRDNRTKAQLRISTSNETTDLTVDYGFALKAEITEVNKVYAGETVGYGGVFKAEQDTHIAVLPIGYADGISTSFHKCQVEINGKLYRAVGVVNMCMLTVEVVANVHAGDVATIIGGAADIRQNASACGNSAYVAMTKIASEIPRIYKGGVSNV